MPSTLADFKDAASCADALVGWLFWDLVPLDIARQLCVAPPSATAVRPLVDVDSWRGIEFIRAVSAQSAVTPWWARGFKEWSGKEGSWEVAI